MIYIQTHEAVLKRIIKSRFHQYAGKDWRWCSTSAQPGVALRVYSMSAIEQEEKQQEQLVEMALLCISTTRHRKKDRWWEDGVWINDRIEVTGSRVEPVKS